MSRTYTTDEIRQALLMSWDMYDDVAQAIADDLGIELFLTATTPPPQSTIPARNVQVVQPEPKAPRGALSLYETQGGHLSLAEGGGGLSLYDREE